MNYRIVEKEAFKIVGKGKRVTCVDGKNLEIIPKFWDESHSNGLCNKLDKLAGSLGLLGICMDFQPEQKEFTYVIAVEKPQVEITGDLIEKEIPAATWAIFESVGPMPGAIQEVWNRIYSEWLHSTGYEHADGPEIEVYLPGNPNDDDYKCEAWIPIVNK